MTTGLCLSRIQFRPRATLSGGAANLSSGDMLMKILNVLAVATLMAFGLAACDSAQTDANQAAAKRAEANAEDASAEAKEAQADVAQDQAQAAISSAAS